MTLSPTPPTSAPTLSPTLSILSIYGNADPASVAQNTVTTADVGSDVVLYGLGIMAMVVFMTHLTWGISLHSNLEQYMTYLFTTKVKAGAKTPLIPKDGQQNPVAAAMMKHEILHDAIRHSPNSFVLLTVLALALLAVFPVAVFTVLRNELHQKHWNGTHYIAAGPDLEPTRDQIAITMVSILVFLLFTMRVATAVATVSENKDGTTDGPTDKLFKSSKVGSESNMLEDVKKGNKERLPYFLVLPQFMFSIAFPVVQGCFIYTQQNKLRYGKQNMEFLLAISAVVSAAFTLNSWIYLFYPQTEDVNAYSKIPEGKPGRARVAPESDSDKNPKMAEVHNNEHLRHVFDMDPGIRMPVPCMPVENDRFLITAMAAYVAYSGLLIYPDRQQFAIYLGVVGFLPWIMSAKVNKGAIWEVNTYMTMLMTTMFWFYNLVYVFAFTHSKDYAYMLLDPAANTEEGDYTRHMFAPYETSVTMICVASFLFGAFALAKLGLMTLIRDNMFDFAWSWYESATDRMNWYRAPRSMNP